jgi:hypothetical protein
MIVEGLRDLAVPIDSVRPLERNPRRGNVEAIKKSLARFGQRRPIVVRAATREVTAGNHLLLAAIELGWTEVAAIVVDDDEQTAIAWSLADNRTHDLGDYDDAELDALLLEVADNDIGLVEAAGFDVDQILATLPPDAEDYIPFHAKDPDPPRATGNQRPPKEVEPIAAYERFGLKADREVVDPDRVLSEDKIILFRFGDLRARVTIEAYKALYDEIMREAGRDLHRAGLIAAERLGLPPESLDIARRGDRYAR